MNSIAIIGNLTRPPENGKTESGLQFTRFSVAVNRRGKGGEEVTDYFPVTAWRNLAEQVYKYLNKGSKVYVAGELYIDTYEKEGVKSSRVSIVADKVEFLTPREKESGANDVAGVVGAVV